MIFIKQLTVLLKNKVEVIFVKRKILFITSILVSFSACAQLPVYTSVTSFNKNVFAGVKKVVKGEEPDTYLVEVNSAKLESKKIELPDDLTAREVIALLPTQGSELVVITQRTVEQGDNPLVHSYHPEKKAWKKLSEINCASFANLKVSETAFSLNCVETNEEGKEVTKNVEVKVSGLKLRPINSLGLPQTKVDEKDLKAELLGDSFDWKELKVGTETKEKTFRP